MGLYVELACDTRGPNCDGHKGDTPQGRTVAQAQREGRRQGWKVGPGNKAVCPTCRKTPTTKDTSHD